MGDAPSISILFQEVVVYPADASDIFVPKNLGLNDPIWLSFKSSWFNPHTSKALLRRYYDLQNISKTLFAGGIGKHHDWFYLGRDFWPRILLAWNNGRRLQGVYIVWQIQILDFSGRWSKMIRLSVFFLGRKPNNTLGRNRTRWANPFPAARCFLNICLHLQ